MLTWQDRKASLTFLTLILIGLMVVTFLPLRFFICLGLIKKFARGSSYYKRKYNSNVQCMKIELRNFFMQHKLYKNIDLYKDEEDWLDMAWLTPKRYKNKLIAHL